LQYGILSGIRNEVRPKRINLVFGNAATLVEYHRPLSITFAAGKAYSVIFTGDQARGYSFILLQEY
ncbi:MAG: hypothetical protein JNL32_08425, partial [Candidatus Kapabacteria bacterium]|nr:hypothetical protein [Candidatus Kapabacteria bacterium]